VGNLMSFRGSIGDRPGAASGVPTNGGSLGDSEIPEGPTLRMDRGAPSEDV
jgi:hypothetical protein